MTKCRSLAASVSNLLRGDSCISGRQLRPVVVVAPASQKRDYLWRQQLVGNAAKHMLKATLKEPFRCLSPGVAGGNGRVRYRAVEHVRNK